MPISRLPDDDELARLYTNELLTMKEVGKKFGVTTQRVQQRLKRMGVKRPKPAIERELLEELYLTKRLSIPAISKALGHGQLLIQSELQRHSIPIRRGFRFEHDLLYKMYVTDGMLMDEIARNLGCSSTTIGNEISRNGIAERHPVNARLSERFTYEHLYHLHVEDKLSVQKIAEQSGCSAETVKYWLNKHGIHFTRSKPGPKRITLDEEILRRLYVADGMTMAEIAEMLGVSTSAIYKELERHSIPSRSRHRMASKLPADAEIRRLYLDESYSIKRLAELFQEKYHNVQLRIEKLGIGRPKLTVLEKGVLKELSVEQGLNTEKIAKIVGQSKKLVRRELKRFNLPIRKTFHFDRDVLYQMYVVDRMSMSEIAAKKGCSQITVSRALVKHGIEERFAAHTRNPRFTYEQLNHLFINQGLSAKRICESEKCGLGVVWHWLTEYGLAIRPSKKIVCTEDVVRKLYLVEEMTVSEVSTKLSVDSSSVREALKRYDIPLRSRRKAK